MKQDIRRRLMEKRDKLSEDEIKEKSEKIKKQLELIPQYKYADSIMFYVSFKSEVLTHDIIKGLLGNKKVIVPKVENGKLILSEIESFDDISHGDYGVLEPLSVKEVSVDDVDVVIVPGIAFDKRGYRIGYGAGYYDKLLAEMAAFKIGLTFEGQIVDEIPKEEHDIAVDIIVTEKRIIRKQLTN